MLRKIFGPKNYDITEEQKRLGNDELYDVYTSSNIIHVIKSTRMGWAGHVAGMGDRRGVHRILVGSSKERETTRKTKAQMGGLY